ncbi:cytochrome P450 [Polycladomyces subterraneus]|uniref:Cytochrome P450 n=1 Tax=Polycladomyces subterraneus TaxID=1016997 RepID=A0ABT8IMN2_9BACL|nr:cytochrome P450 [Polycladomyces subterraneus]MDN4594048.1 cytochrome P450 [Polycladomyces subterraneus]
MTTRFAGKLEVWWTRMRKESPLHYNREHQYWEVFRYEDVNRVLSDHHTFSSQNRRRQKEEPVFHDSILSLDPPQHTLLRSIVSRSFSPAFLREWEPRIRTIAKDLLLQTPPDFDLINHFAYPLPVTVIADMMGVPSKDQPMFRQWVDRLFTMENDPTNIRFADETKPDERKRIRSVQMDMKQYFRDIVHERKQRPQNDLISLLVDSHSHGQISEEEILSFCFLLLLAGHITTTNLIGNAVFSLAEDPETYRLVQKDHGHIPLFIEEVLRYHSPVRFVTRTAAHDVRLGGETLHAGETVVAWIASANRDEQVFDRPDRFIANRKPNPHLAFGKGIHFCLGAPLARMEAQIAMQALLSHWNRKEQIQIQEARPVKTVFLNGYEKLTIAS